MRVRLDKIRKVGLRHRKSIALSLTVMLFIACVTPGKSDYSYKPPDAETLPNEEIINAEFGEVWERLVSNLAQSFFVINNIEKESHIINISFSTSEPELFADCGESFRTYSFRKERADYCYNVAASSTFKIADRWGPRNLPLVWEYVRSTQLEGRANVYIAPQKDNTVVIVNAIYALSVTGTGTGYAFNALGGLILKKRVPIESPPSLSFTTAQPGSAAWGAKGEKITCVSLGKLEQAIIQFARN